MSPTTASDRPCRSEVRRVKSLKHAPIDTLDACDGASQRDGRTDARAVQHRHQRLDGDRRGVVFILPDECDDLATPPIDLGRGKRRSHDDVRNESKHVVEVFDETGAGQRQRVAGDRRRESDTPRLSSSSAISSAECRSVPRSIVRETKCARPGSSGGVVHGACPQIVQSASPPASSTSAWRGRSRRWPAPARGAGRATAWTIIRHAARNDRSVRLVGLRRSAATSSTSVDGHRLDALRNALDTAARLQSFRSSRADARCW